ncbi:hypothetical protein J0H58_35290 [bacterium]|nr:hypothetical protein [bacterium]
MPPAPTNTHTDRHAEPDHGFAGPPDEEFWERYNRRSEFPLSAVAAVLLHVAVGALLVVLLVNLTDKANDRAGVSVTLIDPTGLDESGDGAPGSRTADALVDGENAFDQATKAILPTPEALQKAMVRSYALDDPTIDLPVAPSNVAAFLLMDESFRKRMLGGPSGTGPGDGKGTSGATGTGPGGTGADSTRARSLRWVLRFSTVDGHDYVAQLAAMGATVLVPLPPDNKQFLYFPDLRNPTTRRPATDADLRRLADQIKFSDTRPASVAGVCAALGVREPARLFWAFFPRSLEDELARMETGYRNRRAEDIEETVFRVTVRGGAYEVVVHDQTARR